MDDKYKVNCPDGCGAKWRNVKHYRAKVFLEILSEHLNYSNSVMCHSSNRHKESKHVKFNRTTKQWRHVPDECWTQRKSLQPPMQPELDPNAAPVGLPSVFSSRVSSKILLAFSGVKSS